MSEFIDKGMLLRNICDNQYSNASSDKSAEFAFWQRVLEYVEKIPTADVRLVLKGKWGTNSVGKPICLICGGEKLCNHGGKYKTSNFCPHCGADMR